MTTAPALPPPAITEGQCATTARHDCNPRTINVTTARRMMTDATGDAGSQPRHTFGSANAAQPTASYNALTSVPPTVEAQHTAARRDNNPRTLHLPTVHRRMTEVPGTGASQPRQASDSANPAQPTASHHATTRVKCTTERARHIMDTIRDGATHQMRLGLTPSAMAAARASGRSCGMLLLPLTRTQRLTGTGVSQPRHASGSANAAQHAASHNAATSVKCTTKRARHIIVTVRDGMTHQHRLGLMPSAMVAARIAGRNATLSLMNNRATDWTGGA